MLITVELLPGSMHCLLICKVNSRLEVVLETVLSKAFLVL